MRGTPARASGPAPRRSRRTAARGGVGWWRPPPPRRPGDAEDPGARHSADHAGSATLRLPARPAVPPEAAAPDPRRPDGPGGGGVPTRPGTRRGRSRHRRPLTPEQAGARRRRRLRRGLLVGAAALFLSPFLAFTLGYLFFAVPSPDEAVENQVALVSYADGSALTRLVPEEGNRVKVPIEAVPVHVRQAVLAAEDRTFYSNPGFDLTGILRAAWNQLRGGVGGGSTITQQYVKKTLVGDDATLWRKYKEVVLAVKISQERTKDQILGDYLNAIYFGRGAYGIQSAAQAYFGRDVGELSVDEGAVLAGLIQSPSRWDPAVNPERAVQRWDFVLDGMVSQGWLDRPTREELAFPPTVPRRPAAGGVPPDDRGHIVNAITAELAELGISESDLSQDGLRISSTIDPASQREAVDAAHAALAGQPVNLRSAMVAIDPATGAILAYYGGDNGLGLDYARVRRLAGSTFKPFVVLAGLLRDPPVGLGEVYDGAPIPGLRNAEGAECDRCDLKQAMTVSNNVVFHTLTRELGAQRVADAARLAGITAPLDEPTEGIALGNKEVSALELASAYATIAGGGVWHRPHLVQSVVTADGTVLYDAAEAAEGERRFPERVARNVVEAMLDVADADGLGLADGRPVAAKTGTVQSRFEGENNDAWMAGFTPDLAAAVWLGTDMNSPIRTAGGEPISGDDVPGEVWRAFMSATLAERSVTAFAPFRPIGQAPSALPPNAPPPAPPAPQPPPPPVTPTPDPAAPPFPAPFPPPPPGATDPRAAAGPGAPGPQPTTPPPAVIGQNRPSTAPPRPDCSVTPCG